MQEQDPYISALIELYVGLDRLGPGDDDFSRFIIGQIPELPPNPRIADLGCGSGAGALLLAEAFDSKIKAVDFSPAFLQQLSARAQRAGLQARIETVERNIGDLGWPAASIDLLWSEGAAYSIGFDHALETWRPLLADQGIAVISEMNYFSADTPKNLLQYMQKIYPDIKLEADNLSSMRERGFEVIATHRLPTSAWWDNYYDPLRRRISEISDSADNMMQAVIAETLEEMEIFSAHANHYGYTYFVLRAV